MNNDTKKTNEEITPSREQLLEVYHAARELLFDFHGPCGETLQHNGNGDYDKTTAIGQLQLACEAAGSDDFPYPVMVAEEMAA